MKTFREFLVEVKRSKPRATKLLNYLFNKRGHDLGSRNQMLNIVPQDYKFDRERTTSKGRPIDYDRFDNLPVTSIPVKKIKSDQYEIDREVTTKKIQGKWKGHYPKHVCLIHHKGDYHIFDGNHRVASARLLGKKHIKARVIHADED